MSAQYLLNINFFFFNDTATTEIYTLSLHDALPIYIRRNGLDLPEEPEARRRLPDPECVRQDRKSTRLNSSHSQISYAVFCLKKKKQTAHDDRALLQLPHGAAPQGGSTLAAPPRPAG